MVLLTWRARLRLLLGFLVGLSLLALLLAQVDLDATAATVMSASPALLALAFAVGLFDLALRTARWRALLRGAGAPPATGLRLPLAYMTVGYLGNQLLPARLGDFIRAYLTGHAFSISKLAALGTIMVERVSDGATMLALMLVSAALVSGIAVVGQLAALGLGFAVAGLAALAFGWLLFARTSLHRVRPARYVRDVVQRVLLGMGGMITVRGFAVVLAFTVAVTLTAITVGGLAAGAAGIALSPLQSALFVSAVAMALAIPAAPAAIGTLEFVGVVVLTSLGFAPEQSLAAVLLLRVVSSLPPVLLGVASVWALHLRAGQLLAADAVASTAVGSPRNPALAP